MGYNSVSQESTQEEEDLHRSSTSEGKCLGTIAAITSENFIGHGSGPGRPGKKKKWNEPVGIDFLVHNQSLKHLVQKKENFDFRKIMYSFCTLSGNSHSLLLDSSGRNVGSNWAGIRLHCRHMHQMAGLRQPILQSLLLALMSLSFSLGHQSN